MRLLAWQIDKFSKLMHLDHLNSNEDNDLISIEELRALRLSKQKIENNKKARKYISGINRRYKNFTDKKSKNFFKYINPFKRVG